MTAATGLALLLSAACSDTSDFDFDQSIDEAAGRVAPSPVFDPANGDLPFPNNALFAGTLDRTLNFPVADPADFGDPLVALNALDGFSTTEAATVQFNQPLDPSTVLLGDSVRLFELAADAQTLVPQSIVRELDASEVAAVVVGGGQTLSLAPTRPLAESTSYMALVTNQLRDASGRSVSRPALFDVMVSEGDNIDPDGAIGALAGLSELTRGLLLLGASQGIDPDTVVMVWNFTTQSTSAVLQSVLANTSAGALAVQPSGLTTAAVGGLGAADIMAGAIDVPYYLSAPTTDDPLAPLNSFWSGVDNSNLTLFNSQPQQRTTQSIPLLMTVPNAASGQQQPPAGWPIAIFQHGITRNRADLLAIADSLASAGFAAVAIDLPLHGVTDTTSALYVDAGERTFDLDLQNNDTSVAGPDGIIDDSGTFFINLNNLLNSRDNFRQGVADLFTLSASVGSLPGVDASRKAYIGHSLGAIVGTTMLAFDTSFASATLASPGGGISRLLAGSPTFGPTIAAGLESAGIAIDSADGQRFLNAAQTAIDSADPVNHAAAAAASTPIHLVQIIGDQVVTGSVPGAALAGTEPMARLMGLPVVNQTSTGSAWLRFVAGTHGSILNPADGAAVTAEIQGQLASFAASAGTALTVGDSSLLEAP